ncbi:hypothetical protein DW116_13205 [[Ruminococcus] lactaris]|uniref:Uncharacterized protein n=1 Tax=[Ruminococcus] lactaris TaxID=46228 RepID=A0A415CTF6_9FIRM|nr:hypothetical protein DW116_13205 [[Ruminococcus] lactaris]
MELKISYRDGQRAEVKRACTAKKYPAFRVRFAIKKSFALQAYHPNNYKSLISYRKDSLCVKD